MKWNSKILFDFDEQMKKEGNYNFIIGADEAGRGAGAGRVYAAAVCFREIDKVLLDDLSSLNDSKQLTEQEREQLFDVITKNSIYSVNFSDIEEIRELNILRASLVCMKKSFEDIIEKLSCKNNDEILALVDGNKTIYPFDYPQKFVIKGDTKSASIAAASILAKVSRDRYMNDLDKQYPQYNFSVNKGYLTKDHLEAIDKYGMTDIHRKLFLERHLAPKQISLF